MSRPRSKRPTQFTPWSDTDYFEHFKSKCTITENGCWEHSGPQTHPRGMRPGAKGYIEVSVRGKRTMVHRAMFILAGGVIPPGHYAGHKCDNPPCCNPDHVKPMTPLENSADMIAKHRNYEQQRTECPKGHPYNEENTLLVRAKSGRMARQCRTCNRIATRERWHRDSAFRERQRARRAAKRAQRTQVTT